jgi:prepilin-type N-terminal cleavage/methylation domain-containing protein
MTWERPDCRPTLLRIEFSCLVKVMTMFKAIRNSRKHNRAFTLIELIVVVLILGILATVALPKFIGQSDSAKINGTLQSLSVLRTAIDTYRVTNTSYPTVANLPTALSSYLRTTTFPSVTCGANQNNTLVGTSNSPPTVTAGGAGWVYNATTGEISINDASYISY